MFNAKVILPDGEFVRSYCSKTLISDILRDCGIHQHMPCGGRGVCGKCAVRVSGSLSGIFISCRTYVNDDVCIYYNPNRTNIQGISEGFMSEFSKKPLSGDDDCTAIALDIGTTTIAAHLYSLPDCTLLKSFCAANKQAVYGADVISRLEYSLKNVSPLFDVINEQIADIKKQLGAKPQYMVVTGNTAMLHFLTGKNAEGMATAPFTPGSLFGDWFADMYVPRCMSSFVGADITCAVTASGMTKKTTALLADIGTNGELALWHNNTLTCCSTAAGPALEGACISGGMPAVPGAICRVWIENGQSIFETIAGERPAGICGTGLIDAIACMLATGAVDETGYLEFDFEIGGVLITPADVRQVQLAKAAVSAGIETLLLENGLTASDVEQFFIAGGFGSFINPVNAEKIGLIPQGLAAKSALLGNAALSGAAMILQSRDVLRLSQDIAANATILELGTNPVFMEKYIENMAFK